MEPQEMMEKMASDLASLTAQVSQLTEKLNTEPSTQTENNENKPKQDPFLAWLGVDGGEN